MDQHLRDSLVSAVFGVVLGVVITFGVWRSTTPPRWDLPGVLVAVGLASFFSAFGAAYGSGRTEG